MIRAFAVRSIRIIHSLRTVLALLVFAGLLCALGGLWWANQTGLPDAWRGQIEKALEAKGLYMEFASLRYRPLKGLEAAEVTVFSDATRSRVTAHLKKLVIAVDRSKLARGEVRVEKLELTGGGLSLPADPDDAESRALEVESASGTLFMPGGRRVEVRGLKGMVQGVKLDLDALILTASPKPNQSPQEIEAAKKSRRALIVGVLDALAPWHFPAGEPPRLRVQVEGDLDDPRSMRAELALDAKNFERDDLRFSKLSAKAEMRGSLVVADTLELGDENGLLKGRLEYDLNDRSGRFEAKSDLDLPYLLRQLHVAGTLERVTFQSRPVITAAGEFKWPSGGPVSYHLLGHFGARNISMGEYSADQIDTDFSWDGSRLFLDGIQVLRPDGYLRASILSTPPLTRYRIETDLHAKVFKNLFKGMPLEGVLGDFADLPGAWCHAKVTGWADASNPTNWNTTGTAEAKNISFRGVPVHSASVDMALDHEALDFTGGKVDFDYTDYAMRKAHGGPASGKGTVGRVKWQHSTSTITVENVEGDFWPAPLVRTFAAKVADHLEDYRFHTPPHLKGAGVIGIGPGQKLSDLRVHAVTESGMDYHFAGADLLLDHVNVDVKVGPQITEVRNLTFDAYEGSLRGQLDIDPAKNGGLKGAFDWTKVSLPAVSTAYGFDKLAKGLVTGRIDFEQKGTGTSGLSGEGLVALEQSELFSVPVFGPLSPLISAVIGKKKAGFQEAEEAFCTFTIDKGVLYTDDFLTSTPSLVFTGDATADLNEMTLDMTMRMNARGLLGVITLPLKPFYGLFQFRGQGPIREPKWDNVMFTSPPKRQEKNLMNPPKAGRLEEAEEGPRDENGPPPKKPKRGFFR